MKIGTVLGQVHLVSWVSGYDEVPCKQVRLEDQVLVAADPTGAKAGELVLVSQGSAADHQYMGLRCDALIVGRIDQSK